MRKIQLTLIALCLLTVSKAQNFDKVLEATNVEFLRNFAMEKEMEFKAEKARAIQYCEEKGYPTSFTTSDGRYTEVIGFDETGKLEYATTNNIEAAQTISTDKIQVFGLENYNLSGRGFSAGIWDGGSVRTTHQEFTNRVSLGQSVGISDHATHVAGTMIAQGINPLAKGMAIQATLVSYDFNNPEGEMAFEASNGMLVSNHSWGSTSGWSFGSASGNNGWHWYGTPNVSQTEDFTFGRYGSRSQAWDQIAYNAPYFTIVKSAGNDRSDNGPTPGGTHFVWNNGWQSSNVTRNPDGPSDCMPSGGMAKNIISVGAVGALPNGYTNAAGVNMSNFSSWGPADDSRVKPDLVANGVGVLSSSGGSNTAYQTQQGTSMSGPTIAGSVMLLQEHYSNRNNGDLPRSETVRALLIHTCDEAGVGQGPDYTFGWGLANIKKAADVITNEGRFSMLDENILTNGQTETFQVYSDGTEPLKATIGWLDPAGNPPTPFSVDDPTPALVNDLDLRIISPTDTTFPWKLNAASPSAFATKGDNIVDNVEVVELLNPTPGVYTISVTHKGSLVGGQQTYALVATGIKTADSLMHCSPVVEFNTFSGQFTDGSGADTYANDMDCAWRIEVRPFFKIDLFFEEFDLENTNDFVNVYDGPDANSPLLATYSGNTLPASIRSNSNRLFVTFHSDGVDNSNQGFLATFVGTDCGSVVGTPITGFTAVTLGDTCNRQLRIVSSASNYDSIFWDYGDGVTSTTTDAIHFHSYTNGGVYNVKQIAYGKCFTVDSVISQVVVPCVTTGINDFENLAFKLYPNPTKGLFTVDMNSESEDDYLINIYDLNGSLRYSQSVNSKNRLIDIRELSSGVYFYNIIDGNNTQRGKIIKE